jgi:hypothetical protein
MNRADEIRKEILLQLYAVRPLALSAARLARDAKKNDYDYSAVEIRRELDFLNDEKLIAPVTEPGVTQQLWRINSAGIRQYEQKYAA